jgi:LysR family transcriptional regulator (chromosome initiation inhibitor)
VAIAVSADSLATWFESVAWDIAKDEFVLELIDVAGIPYGRADSRLRALARGEARA